MTLSLPRSNRLGVLALAAIYTTLTLGAVTSPAPAQAASNTVYYTAELAQPTSESRAIASGIAWYCEGTTCKAAKGNSRPLRICRGLARELGEVTSFTAKGEALAEEQLATCNGK
ncbi:hypothetical protein P7228_08290 [Altererythrobacter arenosus]|uniref:Secreted protein n=1 Tax=Altererythrobacter arenosus TaxID=3032592 RepID=A0ABY8FPI0_9SPHN|nr:hypothetical protein [Altererythrobacter sp. CAU 1644]WFL76010.1 hypothetical protein P7228_08290 [Altererythrobacter sp. CAU 1644]